MEIYYINSNLQKFVFNDKDIKIKELNLHEYEYTPKEDTTFFERKPTNIPFTLMFYGSEQKRKDNLEKFHKIISVDRARGKLGKLYFGNYFLEGNFVSEKIYPYKSKGVTVNEIKIYCKIPYWVKETKHSYAYQNEKVKNPKRYNNRYPYRYVSSTANLLLENKHYADSNFKLRIFGPCTNPSITIGKTTYTVYITLEESERLEINSKNKTIVKIDVFGNSINEFNSREKHCDFFKLIPPGTQNISFGKFNFEIILFEERSMPKWN